MSRDTVTIAVRVRPGAARTRVGGSYHGPLGPALVVAVTERAVAGRATEAALIAAARALGLPRRDLDLRAGQTSRDKLITVANPPPDLAERVRVLREGPR